ncbi:MAG: EF-P lysine aminoacylase EpmA [Gammaproteobacteria bacterium]|nr:EF-P lysine aminoacylase EpmA [Gammaproteobacteria bacterium]MDH5304169.1 EF-P lysine aminoacylase EpmA [Gammaproteobacteria bacterium]MDH5321566.1 EF-P lysine aminoacylase EpmA [Gammaproteobacteria bacterium]
MPNWRPTSPAAVARRRAAMLERVRGYFAARDVLAVDTPALSAWTCTDPHIESIAAQRIEASTDYLQTSPESAMKCLLAAGYPDIYSISRVFRAGEQGPRHLPEFTLLEWYRLGFDLAEMVADTTALIAHCLMQPELEQQVEILNYADIFQRLLGVNVFTAGIDELAAAADADRSLRTALGNDRDAWLDLLLATRIANAFAPTRLTVLRHYPRSQAALARPCPVDARVADRFEVFRGTLELANGYVELADATEQRARFAADNERRQLAGSRPVQGDPLLLAALDSGLPACAGVAVGFERLQMIYEQVDDIAKVVTFAARNADA